MPFPFEVPFEEVRADLETYVDEVFGALQSEFLTLPKGAGFVEYPIFEQGYEVLKRATQEFRDPLARTRNTIDIPSADRICCVAYDPWVHSAGMGVYNHSTDESTRRPRCRPHN
jgi:hypothetical protein